MSKAVFALSENTALKQQLFPLYTSFPFPFLFFFFFQYQITKTFAVWKLEQSNDFNSSWSEVLCQLICFILVREWPNPVLLKQPEESNLNLPVWDPRVCDFL